MKNFIFLALLFNVFIANGQAPDWQWAHNAGGNDDEFVNAIAIDPAGNVISGGEFSSPTLTIGSVTLINNGIGNILLTKYDATGNPIWAVSAGNEGDDGISSIATDNLGNIFITGWFSSDTLTIGSFQMINQSAGTGYEYDLFVAKYDNNGNAIWAKSAGGYWDEYSQTITTDASGNVYLGGSFVSDSISFGSFTLHNVNTAWDNLFVVKYDSYGNEIWAKSAGGSDIEVVFSIAVNNSGEVYLSGGFSSNSFTMDGVTLTGDGNDLDVFVVKLDSTGIASWGRTAIGYYSTYALSIKVDQFGNIYTTGFFENLYITFGGITLTNAGGNSATRDIFLVKYDSSGNELWAKSAGGISHEEAYAVALDAAGNPFITGQFESANLTFGTTVLNNAQPGKFETFLTKYDTNGNVLWAKSVSSTNDDCAYTLAVNPTGDGYIAGYFISTLILFSPITLTNANPGMADLFIAKFDATTGVEIQQNTLNPVSIFPNPTTDELTVSVNSDAISEVTLYDMTSKILLKQRFNKSIDLHIDQFVSGVYYYSVSNNLYGIRYGKIVKN